VQSFVKCKVSPADGILKEKNERIVIRFTCSPWDGERTRRGGIRGVPSRIPSRSSTGPCESFSATFFAELSTRTSARAQPCSYDWNRQVTVNVKNMYSKSTCESTFEHSKIKIQLNRSYCSLFVRIRISLLYLIVGGNYLWTFLMLWMLLHFAALSSTIHSSRNNVS
jgi:hypothetical protein